jgi:hypothetical protein
MNRWKVRGGPEPEGHIGKLEKHEWCRDGCLRYVLIGNRDLVKRIH